MSLQDSFIKFHDKIKLNSSTKDELREKRDVLLSILRNSGRLPSFDEFSQGSYGLFLGNEPTEGREYDIDVGLKFNVNKDDYEPLEIKNIIDDILADHTQYGTTIKNPCVTVTYSKEGEKAFHVDLVTYVYENKNNHESQMYLAYGKNSSNDENIRWDKSDPVKLLDYINDQIAISEERDQFRRVVKYLKRWKNLKFKSIGHEEPPSIAITLLVLQSFVFYENDDLSALIHSVESLCSNFIFSEIDEKGRYLYTISCNMPSGLRFEPGADAFIKMSKIQMTDFKDKVEKLRNDLYAVQQEIDLIKQCQKLHKIFGEEFEVPEVKDVSKKQINYIPRSTASGGEDGYQ